MGEVKAKFSLPERTIPHWNHSGTRMDNPSDYDLTGHLHSTGRAYRKVLNLTRHIHTNVTLQWTRASC